MNWTGIYCLFTVWRIWGSWLPSVLAWWRLLSLSGYDTYGENTGVRNKRPHIPLVGFLGEQALSLEILGLLAVVPLDW